MSKPTRCDLYVLCGGQSSRFGSDKALATISGTTMMQAVIQACDQALEDQGLQFDTTLVTGGSRRYDGLGVRSITDQPAGIGPMGGLHAAACDRLTRHGPGWLLLTGCDWVLPKPGWIAPILQKIDAAGPSAVAFHNTRWQPLLTLYHTQLIPEIQRLIGRQAYSLQALLDEASTLRVMNHAGGHALRQANTPADLGLALRQRSGVC